MDLLMKIKNLLKIINLKLHLVMNQLDLMIYQKQIKEFLDGHPEIKAINAQVIRNEGLLISLKHEQQGRE